jgi:RNase P subunit RPR2
MSHTGYCMRCRAHKEMKEVVKLSMKNGRNAVKGTCESCGAGMYKILPTEKKEK